MPASLHGENFCGKEGQYLRGMYIIQSDALLVSVSARGAELKNVYHKEHGLEYMWNANPSHWAKTSPVLFPVVGGLKNNRYFYEGQTYELPRHGFARDKEFVIAKQQEQSLTLSLQSNAETKAVYPFDFLLSLTYTLNNDKLTVRYSVQNTSTDNMYFSIGGHPAFAVPLVKGTSYDDYYLLFEKEETAGRWPISKEGLIEKNAQPFFNGTKKLPLTKELFAKDALVFKNLHSKEVKLLSDKTTHGLAFALSDFPFLGLWAAPGADFVCIEPWQGIADSVDADGELAHKEGIVGLPAGEQFTAQWCVHFF